MAVTKAVERQDSLWAFVTIDYDDLTDATAAEAIDVPANAVVVGGFIVVDTVWNSATSDTLDVGDGSDTDRYTASPLDITSLGRQALTLTGFKYTASDTIDVIWDGTGAAPSTGSLRLFVEYVVQGRGVEAYTG